MGRRLIKTDPGGHTWKSVMIERRRNKDGHIIATIWERRCTRCGWRAPVVGRPACDEVIVSQVMES